MMTDTRNHKVLDRKCAIDRMEVREMSRRFSLVAILLIAVCAAAFGCGRAYAALADHEILKKADEARGNLEGVKWDVSIIAQETGRTNYITYGVQARGFDLNATTLAPPKHRDEKVLMVSGNMWFYRPGLSKPIPISKRQRLMGNASYGDIAATNYAEDYDATRLPDQVLGGEDCYVFDLKARTKDCTYDRIVYWISKDRLVGIKADYYTLSGKKFKSSLMEYSNTVSVGESARPFISKLGINDELMSNDTTVLKFEKPALGLIADSVFNLNLMIK